MNPLLARVTELFQETEGLRTTHPAQAAVRFQAAVDLVKSEPLLKQRLFAELAPRLGAMYIEVAEYAKARQVLTEGLEFLRELQADPPGADTLNLRNSLAVVRMMERDYAGARDEFLAVLEARRQAVPPDVAEIARTLNNLSRAYAELGADSEARRAIEEALDILRTQAPDNDPLLTAAIHNLAVAQMEAGYLEGALYGFQRARRSAEADGHAQTPDFASILHELARLYGEMYRYDEANEVARHCFVLRYNVLGEHHPDTGRAFQTAGRLLRDSGNHPQALLAFRSAYQTFMAIEGLGGPNAVSATFDMMTEARRAPENDDVEQDLRDLLPLARRVGRAGNPFLFRILTDLALWLDGKKNEADANTTAAEAVDAFGTLETSHDPTLAHYYTDLARLRERQHAPLDALLLLDRAIHVDDPLVSRLVACRDDILRRAIARRLAAGTAAVVRLVVEHLLDDPTAATAAFLLVVNRKGLLANAFLARRDADLAARQPSLATLITQVAQLETEVAETQMAGPLDGWRKLLTAVDKLTDQIRDINGEIEFETRFDSRVAVNVDVVTVNDIASRLAPDAALVEFYALAAPPSEGDEAARKVLERTGADEWLLEAPATERYVAFVLGGGSAVPRLVDLGSGAELERLVYSWLAAIGKATDLVPREQEIVEGTEPELSRRLRAKLFDPLRAALNGATTIHMVPDGVVCRVPFAALLEEGDPPTRLIEHITFNSTSSSHAFTRLAQPVTGSGPPFALGDPDFDLAKPGAPAPEPPQAASIDTFYFPRLPGTADEVWRVSQLIGGQRVTSKQAHQSALRAVHSPAILHIATHGYYVRPFAERLSVIGNWRSMGGDWGFFARRQVLGYGANPFTRSGLVLAGANAWTRGQTVSTQIDDGLLTALEVAHLDLHATELVVLSACSTALGDVAQGTSIAGLLYALQTAGARTTVAAMWPIPDEATVAVMNAFYEGVLAGMPRGEALRSAQLTLAKQGGPPWQWAAYVCYGDPTPLQSEPRALVNRA